MAIRIPGGGGSGSGGGTWGSITGTLSAQTDLQTALDAKAVKALSNLASVAINAPLATGAGTTLAATATAPAATTGASQAGIPVTITASTAVASTDTAGAAAGGSVTITGGAAARNASGNADGGDVNVTPGAGIGTGVAGRLVVGGSGATLPAGSAAVPSLVFNDANTGLYALSSSRIGVSRDGSLVFMVDSVGLTARGTQQVSWSSDSFATASDLGVGRFADGVAKVTDGSTGIRGLMGGGAAVASATAMPLPTGRVFHVTGTTTITSITSTNFEAGAVITLIFDDVLTFTDGSNLVLAGDFVTTASDTITLAYDGTNWYETSRSVN